MPKSNIRVVGHKMEMPGSLGPGEPYLLVLCLAALWPAIRVPQTVREITLLYNEKKSRSFTDCWYYYYYPAPDRGTGYCFRSISLFLCLFLCQQDYEKTAEPICMKFPGKVWSDHGTT